MSIIFRSGNNVHCSNVHCKSDSEHKRKELEIAVYLGNGTSEAQLLWYVNMKSYAVYRMVTFSMTLTDP